jgi:cytochrome c-type biogenesis protein CcmH/NrfF
VGECACGHCALVKTDVGAMLKEGKTEAEILDFYVQQQGGSHILSEPPNVGMGRLAWLLPYLLGIAGLAAAITMALRWSHRPAVAGTAGMLEGDDPSLRSRLEDELRDLD